MDRDLFLTLSYTPRFMRDTPDLDAQSRFPDLPHLFLISPADDKTVNLNRLQLASSAPTTTYNKAHDPRQ